jgi:type II secretory pathway pseudopilin PulG
MAALLVGLSVMAVMMSMALPVWSQFAKREKEAELIWRGQQYARAIALFQRKYANTFPPNVDILVEQRFLRKKYKDPITNDDFQPIPVAGGMPPGAIQPPGTPLGTPPPGGTTTTTGPRPPQQPPQQPGMPGMVAPQGIGIQGVVSKSKDSSIKVFNGRTRYNEWLFVHMQMAQRIAPQGVQQPGMIPGAPGGVAPDTFRAGWAPHRSWRHDHFAVRDATGIPATRRAQAGHPPASAPARNLDDHLAGYGLPAASREIQGDDADREDCAGEVEQGDCQAAQQRIANPKKNRVDERDSRKPIHDETTKLA